MDHIFEIILIFLLIAIQSVFGVGLLLFGTPSFLLFGYDFANTINILMPVSITISSLQFFKSKIKDAKFINEYNLFCLPFLLIFLFIALKFKNFFDFKLLVALLLIFSSILILNKSKFSSYSNKLIFEAVVDIRNRIREDLVPRSMVEDYMESNFKQGILFDEEKEELSKHLDEIYKRAEKCY